MKPRIDKDGNKYCAFCNKWICNMKNSQGIVTMRNRALKYCDEYRPIVKAMQTRFSNSNNRKGRKYVVQQLMEQTELLKQENLRLREMIVQLDDYLDQVTG